MNSRGVWNPEVQTEGVGPTSGRWRPRQTHSASSHNQKEDNNKFKNKKQPGLPETRTAWKSDNQGVREGTLTQTGRRDGAGQPGGEDSAGGPGGPTFVCG